jgi:hypothetical protein
MVQAVNRRPPTTEARFRSRVIPCGICGGQSGTGASFSSSALIFLCQFYSTAVPLLGKMKAVEQLAEALRYKPERRGFDSRWCHWNVSLT